MRWFHLLLMQLLVIGCAGDLDRTGGDGRTSANDIDRTESDSQSPGEDLSSFADGTSPCADGETHFQGFCYQALGLGSMSYASSKDLCTSIGALPTSIHSAEENDFVFGLLFHMTRNAWIGLRRSDGSSSEHVWEDGEALSYTNWESGEPDTSECTVMRGPLSSQETHGLWADSSCSSQNREIVCKRRP